MQEDNLQDGPEASKIGEPCPYSGFCKFQDDCPPDSYFWMGCWVYRSLEGLIDYQALMSRVCKKRFNEPGGCCEGRY